MNMGSAGRTYLGHSRSLGVCFTFSEKVKVEEALVQEKVKKTGKFLLS